MWLVGRRNIWTWPIGIVSVLLYSAIFYQINLYGDMIEQVYYLITNLWGWWVWKESKHREGEDLPVFLSRPKLLALFAVGTLAASCVFTPVLANLNVWLPRLFPEPQSFPFLDSLTTTMSFCATLLMVWRRLECWIYWIIVDVIGIGLYAVKGVYFLAALMAVLLVLATKGFLSWRRMYEALQSSENEQGLSPNAA